MTFSTKDRVRALAYPELRNDLDAYTGGILRALGCPAIIVKSVIDHIHIFYVQARTVATATVAENVKCGIDRRAVLEFWHPFRVQ